MSYDDIINHYREKIKRVFHGTTYSSAHAIVLFITIHIRTYRNMCGYTLTCSISTSHFTLTLHFNIAISAKNMSHPYFAQYMH